MSNEFVAYNKSTSLFRAEGLTEYINNATAFISSATVTLEEILDSTGADVLGGAITLGYITDSNGDYEKAYDIDLVTEAKYTAQIKAVYNGMTKTIYPMLIVKDDRR